MRRPEPSALLLAVAFAAVYYGVYAAAAWLGDGWLPKHRLYLAWEPSLPYFGWLAPLYMSVDLMALPVLGLYPTVRELRPLVLALLGELAVAVAIFWLYPLEDGFGDPPPTGLMAVTLRHNYLPSLHVALAFSLAAAMARRSVWGAAAWLWAATIALSTLFLHAHHLADVAAGMGLAWLGMRMFSFLSAP